MAATLSTCTGTVMVQVPGTVALPACGIVRPVNVIRVVPGDAVSVPAPPQVVLAAGLAAMVIFAPIVFRLSVKLVIVAVLAVLRLISVMVSVVTPVRGTDVKLNAFVTATDDTIKVAVALL
jgi:hypothetical protein